MASGKLLRQLIRTGAQGNPEAFRKVSEEIIREERDKHHHLLADDLEKILYGRARAAGKPFLSLVKQVPSDKERGLPLVHIKEPVRRMEDIVLSDQNKSLIEEILQEHHRQTVLKSYGLSPVDRLLFCGPPGCGKTLTAEVLASELGLPLAIVRIDSVVSSYLGETAANLRQVLDFVACVPMVALFDEFDALAKERADAADHGELKRVVNAFLQLLDGYEGKSLLVAATNHEGILDAAIWRRFDEVLVFDPPNLSQLRRLLACKLRGLRREFEPDNDEVTNLFKGMSHADVERVLRRAAKEMVLAGKEFLNERHLQSAIRREDARRARMKRGG
uniref:ATPase family associated with various cellular activities (AAA) n=1 Tax=Candidatus Kentrum sp. FM TaxID=2126340 RepID=A0A450RYK3_9GAMM|nr:MAG: ATPase family associated with various cellular activities (AAA) [Candidatus Kentron sp. FM]VFJ44399.1 MAG: ATPase family associated with various cellular activities (AAA) [Candidatus Kentron sp. FM]VFK06273.1 MAG: ATPase family associated with various cellular activities (AAA) [Candidatus Kentron sp. FM]